MEERLKNAVYALVTGDKKRLPKKVKNGKINVELFVITHR